MRYAILVCLVAVYPVQGSAELVCPDKHALELLAIASNDPGLSGFGSFSAAYSYVIENATRPMDERALRSACGRLAYELTKRTEHVLTKDPDPGRSADIAIALKSQHPILRRCPEKSIVVDSWLPTRRGTRVVSQEMLSRQITGWVTLKLVVNDRGIVERAVTTSSSNPILEPTALGEALELRFQPKSPDNRSRLRPRSVEATIVTDYSHLAHATGCCVK